MIMLSGRNKIDTETYDHCWFATTTCPHMGPGCEHHPEIAGSWDIGKYCIPDHPEYNEKLFYEKYVEEMTSSPKINHLREIVRRSEAGEWFQLIFYELDPKDGERPYLYNILKGMTDNVRIE